MLLINFLDGTIKGFKEYQKFKINKDKTIITINLYEHSKILNKEINLNSVESVRCDGNIIYVNVMAINNKIKNFN